MAAWSGEWDVESLAQRLSPEQLDRWEAFDSVEPIGLAEPMRLLANLMQFVAAANQQSLKLTEIIPWDFSDE